MPRSTRSSRSSSRSVPRAADARLIVMAKHPMPGRVKTRLAAAIGAAAAAALSRAFIRDLATRLAALPYAVTWAYSPRGAPFRAVLGTLPAGWRCRLQRGQDLGERMANAIRDELRALVARGELDLRCTARLLTRVVRPPAP